MTDDKIMTAPSSKGFTVFHGDVARLERLGLELIRHARDTMVASY